MQRATPSVLVVDVEVSLTHRKSNRKCFFKFLHLVARNSTGTGTIEIVETQARHMPNVKKWLTNPFPWTLSTFFFFFFRRFSHKLA